MRTCQYISHICIEAYGLQYGTTYDLDHLSLLLNQLTLTLMLHHVDHATNLLTITRFPYTLSTLFPILAYMVCVTSETC